jgi:DHA1 family tetracycline resistance protein-like MFS transporter
LRRANPVGSLKLLRSHPELFGLATALFLYFNAHESLPSMFVIYTTYRYDWGAQLTGVALAAIGVTSTFVSAVLIAWTVKRLGDRNTLFAGMMFGIAGFALYALSWNTLMFIALACPLVSLWGLASPPLQSLMTRRVSPSEQGQLQGANSSLLGIAGMIAPLVFTSVFAFAISPRHPWQLPGAPYWLASALLAASLAIAWTVTRPKSTALATASAAD